MHGKPLNMRNPSTDELALVNLLKKCGRHGDLERGDRIYADLCNSGTFGGNPYIASALVSLYAKCGKLEKAHEVLDRLPVRNVVSWNALLSGYAQHGYGNEAWSCFDRMQGEGLSPDPVTLLCIFKACGKVRDACKGARIHAWLAPKNTSTAICNAITDMYSKCGELGKAEEAFHCARIHDVVSWNVLIAGYADHGHAREALLCYEEMLFEGLSADEFTFVPLLKAYRCLNACEKGGEMHAKIVLEGFSSAENSVLGNALVDMYAKFGLLEKAKEAFGQIRTPNLVAWNTLLTGYSQQGHEREAIGYCFQQMQQESILPDKITYVCVLKSCGSIRASNKGKEMHCKVVAMGLLEQEVFVGNALADMYVKCGMICRAKQVFDELPIRDVSSWNVLVAGYSENGEDEKALECLRLMQCHGSPPNAITIIYVLKACGSMKSMGSGKQIHARIAVADRCSRKGKAGGEEEDDDDDDDGLLVGTALVDMYAQCGEFMRACEALDRLAIANIVAWNALISGYASHGRPEEALDCFARLRCRGLSPNEATFRCLSRALGGGFLAPGRAEEIHAEIAKQASCGAEKEWIAAASMGMYANRGLLGRSEAAFEELRARDVAAWDLRISSLVGHGRSEEAWRCLSDMQRESVSPDAATCARVVRACASSGAAQKGKQMHAIAAFACRGGSAGRGEGGEALAAALMEMYAKCGLIRDAREVFDRLEIGGGLAPRTALMAAYAQRGQDEAVMRMLGAMGEEPDKVVFAIVLNAFCQSGLVEEAVFCFAAVASSFRICPAPEHCTCLADALGRAGQLDRALAFVEAAPLAHCPTAWAALLGACKSCANLDLGGLALRHSVELDAHNAAAFVCMSNMCSSPSIVSRRYE